MTFTQRWCYYASHPSTQQQAIHPASMNSVFANCSEEDLIYPLTVKEITEAQETDPNICKLTKDPQYTRQLVKNTQLLCKGTAMVLWTAFNIEQLVGTITISNTLERPVLKRHSVLQCIGKVCKLASKNMSKTFINAK